LKKLITICGIFYFTLLNFTYTQAADIKIGVVNPVRVLEASPQADSARKRLEQEFAPRDRKLINTQKNLKDLDDRLAKSGGSDGERHKLERDLLNSKREFQREQDEFRDDLNFRRNEEFGKIQKLIVEAIQAVAKEGGYDIIVGEGVLFASEQVDVTAKVIERLKGAR
jgi:outer membrane protein